MKKIVIATRGSRLALWQAEHVKKRLEQNSPDLAVALLTLKTQGDKILDTPLAKIGGKGLFVKEIEEALLDGRADLAVHSMKDVPVALPEGLVIGTIPEREDPTDTLLSVHHACLADLPAGALVGTSSLRRQSQLLTLRPDLRIESLRGNVDTRLRKLMDGQYAAIIMATSGLNRLGISAPMQEVLAPPRFLPAVAQGALGIEYVAGRTEVAKLLAPLEHYETRVCVEAERGFLTGLDGGCQVPIAGHATLDGGTVTLTGLVADTAGVRVHKRSTNGPVDQAKNLGFALAKEVLDAGGKTILDELYQQS